MQREGTPLSVAFAAVDVFLTWLSYVEAAVEMLKPGFGSSDHPPPVTARRDRLRQMFVRSVPKEDGIQALALALSLEATVAMLFEPVGRHLQDLRRAGVQASPVWGHFSVENPR